MKHKRISLAFWYRAPFQPEGCSYSCTMVVCVGATHQNGKVHKGLWWAGDPDRLCEGVEGRKDKGLVMLCARPTPSMLRSSTSFPPAVGGRMKRNVR